MTEDLLKSLCRHIYGSEHVLVPQFDIHQKNEEGYEPKFLELDFRGSFKKYDVMTEIGVDSGLLNNQNELSSILIQKIKQEVLPLLSAKNKDKAKKLDKDLNLLNQK